MIRTSLLAGFATLALVIGAGPSFAATLGTSTYLQKQTPALAYTPKASPTFTQTKPPCFSREVYVPGPGGALGHYKDSCTGAFIRPAVN